MMVLLHLLAILAFSHHTTANKTPKFSTAKNGSHNVDLKIQY